MCCSCIWLWCLFKGFAPKALHLGIGQSVGLIMLEQVSHAVGCGAGSKAFLSRRLGVGQRSAQYSVLVPCTAAYASTVPSSCWPSYDNLLRVLLHCIPLRPHNVLCAAAARVWSQPEGCGAGVQRNNGHGGVAAAAVMYQQQQQ
jgi:hypothetical protein